MKRSGSIGDGVLSTSEIPGGALLGGGDGAAASAKVSCNAITMPSKSILS